MATIGERLQQVRWRRDKTQDVVARLVAKHGHTVTGATISNYENGNTKPPLKYLEALLKVFPEVRAEWLLTGQGGMTKADEDERLLKEGDPERDPYGIAAWRHETRERVEQTLQILGGVDPSPGFGWFDDFGRMPAELAFDYITGRFPLDFAEMDASDPDEYRAPVASLDAIHGVLAPILGLVVGRRYGSRGEYAAAVLTAFAAAHLRDFGSASDHARGDKRR